MIIYAWTPKKLFLYIWVIFKKVFMQVIYNLLFMNPYKSCATQLLLLLLVLHGSASHTDSFKLKIK